MSTPVIVTIVALVAACAFFACRAAYYLELANAEQYKRAQELTAFDLDRRHAAARHYTAVTQHAADLDQLLTMAEDWLADPQGLALDGVTAMESVRKALHLKGLMLANRPQ
ncbi:hypothetical protein MRQ47_004453 [Salmonella enterica]|nr:hypothetical protein [Salmonella enterica]